MRSKLELGVDACLYPLGCYLELAWAGSDNLQKVLGQNVFLSSYNNLSMELRRKTVILILFLCFETKKNTLYFFFIFLTLFEGGIFHSFNRYLMSVYCMPGISQAQGYSVNRLYWSHGAFILKGADRQIINRFFFLKQGISRFLASHKACVFASHRRLPPSVTPCKCTTLFCRSGMSRCPASSMQRRIMCLSCC